MVRQIQMRGMPDDGGPDGTAKPSDYAFASMHGALPAPRTAPTPLDLGMQQPQLSGEPPVMFGQGGGGYGTPLGGPQGQPSGMWLQQAQQMRLQRIYSIISQMMGGLGG